ncbi:hypothetical protein [uncultured Amphritea sp.]|uniref:hypothetical protein n=1 Tax=uncultured Amphritea sp. TaxID=981605 RepID=UPI0026396C28|nr:hypothetical protein [uncultured Amphritea sp.]
MKRLSIGLGSVFLLMVIAVYAGNDNVTGRTEHSESGTSAAMSKEDAHRQATREAIQRAVLGGHTQQELVEKRYESVSHEEIAAYVGSWVKLETYFGRKVEGTLKSVDGDILYIDEHLGQGSASYPIDKTKLSGLKVLR